MDANNKSRVVSSTILTRPEYEFDQLVFIGRICPEHAVHSAIVNHGLSKAQQVIMLLGSDSKQRHWRTPLLTDERAEIVKRNHIDAVQSNRLLITSIRDYPYNEAKWLGQVQSTVAGFHWQINYQPGERRMPRIGLVGCSKDGSSYYLDRFPRWKGENVPVNFNMSRDIGATEIRHMYFASDNTNNVPWNEMRELVTPQTFGWLQEFYRSEGWYHVYTEKLGYEESVNRHKAKNGGYYPPVSLTTDMIVVQSGHILMQKRAIYPYKGKWCLPGGYVEGNEDIRAAGIRELTEETGLSILPKKTLYSMAKKHMTFAAPFRDPRGRGVTTAFIIELHPSNTFPKVYPKDGEATEVDWIPIGSLKEEDVGFDHFHIIETMISKLDDEITGS